MSFDASANNHKKINVVRPYVLAEKTVWLVSAHVASVTASIVTTVMVVMKMTKMRCLVMMARYLATMGTYLTNYSKKITLTFRYVKI